MNRVQVNQRDHWARQVKEALASGLSTEEWCELNGVNETAFRRWAQWFVGSEEVRPASEVQPTSAVEVPILERTVLPSGVAMELEGRSGARGRSSKAEGQSPVADNGSPIVATTKPKSQKNSGRTGKRSVLLKDESVTFVEMPQFVELFSQTGDSPAPNPTAPTSSDVFSPKLMLRVGPYELYIDDGVEETTLAMVLEVVSHA